MSGTESKWCMGGKLKNVSVRWVIRDRVGNVRESQGKLLQLKIEREWANGEHPRTITGRKKSALP